MTGHIRFILAFFVMLSHTGFVINGLNPGVIAVIVFYILAGGVVTHLWHDILPNGKFKLWSFYRDRVLRIYPLYLYIALLTTLFIAITNFGEPRFSYFNIITNGLIVPLNYFMYLDNTVLTDPSWWLIPQAWSLGTELQAYLVLPLLIVYKRVRWVILLLSVLIYMLANLNYLHTDYFGYRLLPGVLFIFIIGCILKESKNSRNYQLPIIIYTLTLVTYIIFDYYDAFKHVYTQETLLGILIGIPLITVASATNVKLPFNKLAGNLSYGIFLSHFLVIWLLEYY